MLLKSIAHHLDALAPPHLAESWDNVGLLVGDPAADVSRAILCIDYTAAVAEEAKAARCDLVFAYHPPIFKPLKAVTAGGSAALVFDAVRRGVAIYSPHTALDVAAGGTNDVLADVAGIVADRRPLRPAKSESAYLKLVTFVPPDHLDAVAAAVFAAGAGRLGDYSQASFRSPGTGTFFGEADATPAVGERGRLEMVPEIRFETILPVNRRADVVAAMLAAHPYEMPAFDLLPRVDPPATHGLGRIGRLAGPTPVAELVDRLKVGLGVDRLLVAGSVDRSASVVAVCAGACGDHLDDAIAARADVYVTGEMRHHDALRAAAAGVTVVCTLHSHSERVTLRRLVPTLIDRMPDVSWRVSVADADPFSIV